jgi:hypothetical protein
MAQPGRKKSPPREASGDQPKLDFLSPVSSRAVFSFLKDMRGVLTWTASQLVATLNVRELDADAILTVLQTEGYIVKTESGEWSTTASGQTVSGSKQPRFQCHGVDGAVSALFDRIAAINRDSNSEFRVTEAVAYGDFLLGRENCQAADVGIELTRQRASTGKGNTNDFLQHLSDKSRFLNIQPYEKWMSDRSHRRLLQVESVQRLPSKQPPFPSGLLRNKPVP